MTSWEYMHVTAQHAASFSDLGADGWELVGLSEADRLTGHVHFYFKRARAAPESIAQEPGKAGVRAGLAERKKR